MEDEFLMNKISNDRSIEDTQSDDEFKESPRTRKKKEVVYKKCGDSILLGSRVSFLNLTLEL